MRIALVTEVFFPKIDGIVLAVEQTARYLIQAGHEVLILAPSGGPAQLGTASVVGFPALTAPFYPEMRIPLPHPGAIWALRGFRPDVVHAFSPISLGWICMAAAHRAHLPIIASYQTDLAGFAPDYGWRFGEAPIRWLVRAVHQHAHVNLAPSNETLRQLAAWKLPHLRLWKHGVDSARFDPAKRSAEWRRRLLGERLDTGQTLVLSVGRLAREKHLEKLRPVAELPNVALTIVGDGPMRASLERQFAGTGTVFSGLLRGDDLACAFASADLFVLTCASETFSLVVTEALASGLPVIAPAAGGPLDLVTDGVTGSLYPAHDPASLVAAVQQLAQQPGRRLLMGSRGREAMQGCSWEAMTHVLLDYYREAYTLAAAEDTSVAGGSGAPIASLGNPPGGLDFLV